MANFFLMYKSTAPMHYAVQLEMNIFLIYLQNMENRYISISLIITTRCTVHEESTPSPPWSFNV